MLKLCSSLLTHLKQSVAGVWVVVGRHLVRGPTAGVLNETHPWKTTEHILDIFEKSVFRSLQVEYVLHEHCGLQGFKASWSFPTIKNSSPILELLITLLLKFFFRGFWKSSLTHHVNRGLLNKMEKKLKIEMKKKSEP